MTQTWEEHQKLLDDLDRQRMERETREAQERQEAAEAPLREQALERGCKPKPPKFPNGVDLFVTY